MGISFEFPIQDLSKPGKPARLVQMSFCEDEPVHTGLLENRFWLNTCYHLMK